MLKDPECTIGEIVLSIRKSLLLMLITTMALSMGVSWLLSKSQYDRQVKSAADKYSVEELTQINVSTEALLRKVYFVTDLGKLLISEETIPGTILSSQLKDFRSNLSALKAKVLEFLDKKTSSENYIPYDDLRARLSQNYESIRLNFDRLWTSLDGYERSAELYMHTMEKEHFDSMLNCLDDFVDPQVQINELIERILADENEVFSKTKNDVRSRLLLFFVLFAAFSGALIYFGSNMIAQPLEELSEEARRTEKLKEEFRYSGNRYLFSEANQLVQSIASLVDKRNEEEQDLEDRVSRRDAELAHLNGMDQLGVVTGNVAHDFSNILTIVLGYTEMSLRRDDLSDEIRRHLDQVLSAAKLGKSITAQLLKVSRKTLEDESPVLIDIVDFVHEMEPLWKPLLGAQLEVRLSASAGVGKVLLEERKLTQILMNLLTNARDAMAGSGDYVEVIIRNLSVEELQDLRGEVDHQRLYSVIEVKDQGCGIPEEMKDRLYLPYETTKSTSRGTGFGLAIVHNMVHVAGGWIDYTTQKDVGTTFRILLPQAGGSEEVAKKSGHLLIVEDEDSLREIIVMAMESEGYQVTAVSRGGQALSEYIDRLDEFDALVTDVRMPGIDGDELVRLFRKERKDLPVIFISGHSFRSIEESHDPAQPTFFLQKPFSTDELSLSLDKLFQMKS